MKQPIRYFAIGLLTASLLLFIAYYFFKPDAQTATESVDDMIIAIEDEGYRVVTESEYISLAVSDEASDEQSENEEDRKSTRLNSSHVANSYAVFCLKKKI